MWTPAEIIGHLFSLPLAAWRSLTPREIREDFTTYSLDGSQWFDPDTWRLEICGLVNSPQSLTWNQFQKLERVEETRNFHCITGWSVLGRTWGGVPWRVVKNLVGPLLDARYVRFESFGGYASTFKTGELEGAILADRLDGKPLPSLRGGPLRLLAPNGYYQFKSVKGLARILFEKKRRPGFWEILGYGPSGKIYPLDQAKIKKLKLNRHEKNQ